MEIYSASYDVNYQNALDKQADTLKGLFDVLPMHIRYMGDGRMTVEEVFAQVDKIKNEVDLLHSWIGDIAKKTIEDPQAVNPEEQKQI
jgi:hypothetical protein